MSLNNLAHGANEDPGPPFHGFNPIQYLISTRIPALHDEVTACLGNVPFAMSLVDMIRPQLLVQLGIHLDVSYCAFCQAVKELLLPTMCYSVSMSHATFHKDEEEVFERLKAHHDERYSKFSRVMRSTFDDAVQHFHEGSIDLLHIDGGRAYDAVNHDFETWLPKMSDRGVVLIDNIDMDREAFGPYWDEVKRKFLHFEFFHSCGLGVLAVGRSVPDGLGALIDLSLKDQVRVRQYFANLGTYLTELQSIAIQRANLYELLDAKTNECKRLEEERERFSAEIETERAAMLLRLGRFRYQMVDRTAEVFGKVPFLPGITRFIARAIIKLVQKAR